MLAFIPEAKASHVAKDSVNVEETFQASKSLDSV